TRHVEVRHEPCSDAWMLGCLDAWMLGCLDGTRAQRSRTTTPAFPSWCGAAQCDKTRPGERAMSIYEASVPQFKKMLVSLDKWLDAAVAFAQKKSFDPSGLLAARLAPDQFAFVRQVQASCDNAKLASARLSGKEAPKHPDTEQTVDELHARIRN